MTYQLNTIQTYEGLLALKGQWDRLLEHVVYDTFFCSHDWICSWWQSFARSDDIMAVVTAEKNGEVIAIAPLMIRTYEEYGFRLRVLRFIGVPNADRCDIIIGRDDEAVLQELADHLVKNVPGWSQFHLNEVPEESLFANWLQANRPLVYIEPGSECPYIPLANWDSWDAYYASLSRNTRKLANRKGNRLKKEGLSHFFTSRDFQGQEQLFRQAGELERTSEKASRIEHLVLGNEEQYAFQKSLATRQGDHEVLLLGLERKGELLAYLYGFIYKNKYYAYNTAYLAREQNHSPGLLVFRETIKYCKEHNIEEFDFLRGAMQIKKHWAKETSRKQKNIYWLKNSPLNWLYAMTVFTLRPFLKSKVLPVLKKARNATR